MCKNIPNWEMILEMYAESGTPQNIIEHMKAVADFQDRLLDDLESAGLKYDRKKMRAAALLHDVKRTERNHAHAGAEYVAVSGFPEVAALIEGHHSPADPSEHSDDLTEADLLFYADKRLQGSEIVSVAERFAASAKKCTTEEAIKKHNALLARAIEIESKINKMIAENNIGN